MKHFRVLVLALCSGTVAAAPLKRDVEPGTGCLCGTVVVCTTVWRSIVPGADATTAVGKYLNEQSTVADTAPAASSAYVYAPGQEPSGAFAPAVETPAATASAVSVSSVAVSPTTASSAAPAPRPVTTCCSPPPAAPATTDATHTPTPISSATTAFASAAPVPTTQQQQSAGPTRAGERFVGVDLTINPLTGALGACGEPMYATDMYVALAAPAWGASTYDTMTGKATNKWCGQKVRIEYGGKSVDATIMDMCPGCAGHDIDLSDAAWAAIGMAEWTRVQGSWSVVG